MVNLFAVVLAIALPLVASQCNPLQTASCPPIPGLPTPTYSVDFTKQTSLPDGWILADSANVTFGPNGAKFCFTQRGQAPYIWTNFYIAYGRVDVELMVSNGTGIISSSVLFSDDADEIDWEFSGSNFGTNSGKAWANYFGKGITGNYDRAAIQNVDSPQMSFHTYSWDWTPELLTWYIDGVSVHTQANYHQESGDYQYPQTPARLHLGCWDAGDPNTAVGTVNWAGGYTDYNHVPYHAIVRSVKISTPYPCASWQYPPNFSGKWSDVRCLTTAISSTSTSSSSTSQSASSTSTSTSTQIITSSNSKCTANSYKVSSGDYGYGIAEKFGLPFPALSSANIAVNWNELYIGERLNVPCSVTATSMSTIASSSGNSASTTKIIPASTSASTTSSSSSSTFPISSASSTDQPHRSIPPISATSTTAGSTVSSASSSSTASRSSSVPSVLTSSNSWPTGWMYKSCFTDNLNPRSLNAWGDVPGDQMNSSRCISHCDSRGFRLAGTEWSGECYCGMTLNNSMPASESDCNMPCYGSPSELCGGNARLNLYYDSRYIKSSELATFSSSTSTSSSSTVVPARKSIVSVTQTSSTSINSKTSAIAVSTTTVTPGVSNPTSSSVSNGITSSSKSVPSTVASSTPTHIRSALPTIKIRGDVTWNKWMKGSGKQYDGEINASEHDLRKMNYAGHGWLHR